ncbi:hypothetical protein BCR32DRAFT_268887 [Anaeromyces robustus]|jgi:hypothetical protein|uniref:Coth-domain-containing protein n=1 Tax=Anaeromyces robustus TaxID=1754192 RepID=A0A1Y1X509_9FUNG|nr:hypothetical protein BCR32DRAFT_268887 [Anaeromyces robustus]|eukprot:ORX80404.1 hypothetical protein BCR32DRAFT_268887 [Anaeromyces robustus]
MNRFYLLGILLIAILNIVYGRIVTFSVIAFGNEVSVTINGIVNPMRRIDDYSNVHSVTLMLEEVPFEYFYTVDGQSDGYIRTLDSTTHSTYIEFFGRERTIKPLKGMGYPPDKPQWVRSIGKTEVFDESYIPTIIVDAGSKDYFVTGNDTWTLGRFTMILKDEIFTEENVPTKCQNRYEDKFQWRVKLQNKIHKRSVFKFRANAVDPTFYRQSLYGDMAAAVGNPVHNQVICRVYLSDGTPIGLYLMIEVTSSRSFIKTQFYGNEISGKVHVPNKKLGFPLDCRSGADFYPNGPYDQFIYSVGENNEKIAYLSKAMHEVDVYNEADVQRFNKEWFDLDVFLRAMALEYLTGDWDSYWMDTCNYVMYDAPEEFTENTFKYYFIDQDFDLTFGIGLSHKVNLYGDAFPSQSYKTLVNRTWNVGSKDPANREAIDIFLRGGITTTMFENHLIDIVKHVFNPVALGRRLEEYIDRYTEEVQWDYTIERLRIANNPNHTRYVFTMDDYYANLGDTKVKSAEWGLMRWIKMRAQAVAEEFGFEWDQVPLDPSPKNIPLPVEEEEEDNDKETDESKLNVNSGFNTITTVNIACILILLTTLILTIYL